MSTAPKKPPATGSGSGGVARRPADANYSPGVTGRNSTRSPTSSAASSPSNTSSNGLARSRSIRGGTPVSARAALQRSGAGVSNLSSTSSVSDTIDDDTRAETVVLLDDLKERLRLAEMKSDQFQKQAEVLQSRLDQSLLEQGKLEDRLHESEERIESMENEKRDMSRQMREMESIYEAERIAINREREDMANREEDMQTVIQRLKDNLAQKSNIGEDDVRVSRRSNNSSPNIDNGHFAPPSALQRSDSRNNSKLLLQKDRVIESLRLELAEAQIKLVETENMGGGRLQEVERLLMEARMTNARLMEDNESYQLLLSEKTLNGDFTKDNLGYMTSAANAEALDALEGRKGISSLADELSEAAEGESENYRRLEIELKSARDQNKALTLYINKIIERLLQHQDFESILDQSSDFKIPAAAASNVDEDLPPPPPPKEASSGGMGGMLQRAKSVMGSSSKPSRPSRPASQLPAPHSALTDPDTAPSIPIGLGRSTSVRQGPSSRPRSDQFSVSIVNQMYKGPPPGPQSPTHGPQTPRNSQSFFAPPPAGGNPNAAARQPSGSYQPQTQGQGASGTFPGGARTSDTSSLGSGESYGEVTTPPPASKSQSGSVTSSPPRGEKEKATATFAGNKPRPLQLVQNQSSEAQTSNKRASWMGWALGKKEELFPSTETVKE